MVCFRSRSVDLTRSLKVSQKLRRKYSEVSNKGCFKLSAAKFYFHALISRKFSINKLRHYFYLCVLLDYWEISFGMATSLQLKYRFT